MTTKAEIISALKLEYPTLKTGNNDDGYIDLEFIEYEAKIAEWADARLAKEAQIAEAEALAQAKLEAVGKLTALGLDPRAFGL